MQWERPKKWQKDKKIIIMLFAVTWMDLEIITLTEVKDKHHVISHMWNLIKNYLEVPVVAQWE